MASEQQNDWWSSRFGNRGLIQLLVGNDIEAEALVTVVLTVALAYLVVVDRYYDIMGSFINIIIFVFVFFFLSRFLKR